MGKSKYQDYRATKQGHYRFQAVLAPKEYGGRPRIRWYKSPKVAGAARRSSWDTHKSKQAAAKRSQAEYRPTANQYDQCNPTEQTFIRWAELQGYEVHRNGWPDFMTVTPSGEIIGIEVKSSHDMLSADQHRCHELLNRAGVKTFVWHQTGEPIPYHEYAGKRPPVDGGAKAAGRTFIKRKKGQNEIRLVNPASKSEPAA